jgi:terminase small subunit / prophage DNA-packing protein
VVTTAELAGLFGVSSRTVQNLAGRGIAVRAGRGRYRLAESIQAYCAHLREVAAGRGGEDGVFELTAERARLAKEQADGHALKNAALRGRLIEVQDVARHWADILRLVRAGVLAVPSRCQQRLAHLTAADVAVIDRECRDALQEIAGNDDDRRRAAPSAGVADTAAAA